MGKRPRDDDAIELERAEKRQRPAVPDRLTSLSDELVLRVLSFLSVRDLVICQRLSNKYNALAGDGQLWKSRYYDRWVRPRASRLPGLKDSGASDEGLHFASKAARWLDDDHLVKRGTRTNWKRQYKLRHNWSKGSCAVNEIEVAEQAPVPPVLVQMHDGIIYIADRAEGLRAWSAKGERRLIAQSQLAGTDVAHPTSLAVDSQAETSGQSRMVLGFEDGSFSVYALRSLDNTSFEHQYSHEQSSNGVISAVALAWPYIVTMTATQRLSLYLFRSGDSSAIGATSLKPPILLHSLKSQTIWPPLSMSLRPSETSIVVAMAYSLPTYLSGWTVGIQEIRIDRGGQLLDSRLTSAIDEHYRPLAFAAPPIMHHLNPPFVGNFTASTSRELRQIHSKPTTLSYTHPYLLVSHPDNTLTLYLVTSTTDSLSISVGSRLWGHTSSVSGAHVGRRGKAVSVSRRGDELRVWELEGGFASSAARRRLATGDLSVQVKPEGQDLAQSGLDLVQNSVVFQNNVAGDQNASELTLTRGWIGFDDENVVVLKEQSQGRQALVVYDFT